MWFPVFLLLASVCAHVGVCADVCVFETDRAIELSISD